MTEDHDLPIHTLLRLASGSWAPLEDLVQRMQQQPDVWLRDAAAAVGIPADATILDLDVDQLEAARDRLRAERDLIDPELALLANLLIITAGVARDRLLTSATIVEVEYAITALATALPECWNEVLDRALTSPLLDPPSDLMSRRNVM